MTTLPTRRRPELIDSASPMEVTVFHSRARPVPVPSRLRGASLIEVLIAVLVLAIGMLGIAAMQSISLRNSMSALERSQATVQTYAILDSMRANLDVARAGGYSHSMTTACTAPAAGTTLVSRDINFWLTSLRDTLGPTACGGITCAAGICEISIRWNDERGSGGAATQFMNTRSQL